MEKKEEAIVLLEIRTYRAGQELQTDRPFCKGGVWGTCLPEHAIRNCQ
jgi:hypothetical protein